MRKVHHLDPHGGAGCGAQFVETSKDMKQVTCLACVEAREARFRAYEAAGNDGARWPY